MGNSELTNDGKIRRLVELATREAFFQFANGQRLGFGDSDLNKAMYVSRGVRVTLEEFGVLRSKDPAPTRRSS